MTKKYENIINMPHHVSSTRPHMSIYDRAAQFSPFAALTGYDEAISETARYTDTKIELTESEKLVINEKLIEIKKHMDKLPQITINYFIKDSKKSGGRYNEICSNVIKLDTTNNCIILENNISVFFDDIYSIENITY